MKLAVEAFNCWIVHLSERAHFASGTSAITKGVRTISNCRRKLRNTVEKYNSHDLCARRILQKHYGPQRIRSRSHDLRSNLLFKSSRWKASGARERKVECEGRKWTSKIYLSKGFSKTLRATEDFIFDSSSREFYRIIIKNHGTFRWLKEIRMTFRD